MKKFYCKKNPKTGHWMVLIRTLSGTGVVSRHVNKKSARNLVSELNQAWELGTGGVIPLQYT